MDRPYVALLYITSGVARRQGKAKAALPRTLLPRHVVGEIHLQHDAIAFEFGGEGRERNGGADAGHRRAVQGFGAGEFRDHQLGNAAIAADGELNGYLAPAPELD